MTLVDFYSKQVKYSGSFNDYTEDDLIRMAIAQSDSCDCFDRSELMEDTEAEQHDGKYTVDNTYPCNKICTVYWSYIAEDMEEGD